MNDVRTVPEVEISAPGEVRVKRALVTVSDKTGIVEFARCLRELGVEIVSTGGTARHLAEAGVETRRQYPPLCNRADGCGFYPGTWLSVQAGSCTVWRCRGHAPDSALKVPSGSI